MAKRRNVAGEQGAQRATLRKRWVQLGCATLLAVALAGCSPLASGERTPKGIDGIENAQALYERLRGWHKLDEIGAITPVGASHPFVFGGELELVTLNHECDFINFFGLQTEPFKAFVEEVSQRGNRVTFLRELLKDLYRQQTRSFAKDILEELFRPPPAQLWLSFEDSVELQEQTPAVTSFFRILQLHSYLRQLEWNLKSASNDEGFLQTHWNLFQRLIPDEVLDLVGATSPYRCSSQNDSTVEKAQGPGSPRRKSA